jgi:hypothetical protein
MPFDRQPYDPLRVKGGTARINTLFSQSWREGKKTCPTVQDVILKLTNFEKENPKQDIPSFEFNKSFDLGSVNAEEEPCLYYGGEVVTLRFLQDYCSMAKIERKAFNSLWGMQEYEFATAYLNKYNNPRRNTKTIRKQQIGEYSVLRGFNSEHFTIIQDSVLLADMIDATPALADMPVVDCKLRENDFMLRLLRDTSVDQISLRKSFPALTITHGELGGKALWGTASTWTPLCFNGMQREEKAYTFRRIHRGELKLDFSELMDKMLMGSYQLLEEMGQAQRVTFRYSADTVLDLFEELPKKQSKPHALDKRRALPAAFRHWATESLRDVFTRAETEAITKRCGFFKGTVQGQRNQWKTTTRSPLIISPPNTLAYICDGITEWSQDQPDRTQIEKKSASFQKYWLGVANEEEENQGKLQKVINV